MALYRSCPAMKQSVKSETNKCYHFVIDIEHLHKGSFNEIKEICTLHYMYFAV